MACGSQAPVRSGRYEARRAVAALRAAGCGHRCLRFTELAILSQRLKRDELAVDGCRDQQQATVHRSVCAAVAITRDHDDGAGVTFTVRATFFGTGQPRSRRKSSSVAWTETPSALACWP